MTTLRALAAVPGLGLDVVHAGGGLDCEVRWAHVTELPDPRKYLRTEEVVLTNGLWRQRDEDCDRFVAALVSASVCGLVYGLLSEVPEVPPALVAACSAHRLPLLTLAIDVPFAQVTQTVARLQADERQRGLVASVHRGQALLQAAASGAGAVELLSVLARDDDLPVALLDGAGQPLATHGLDASRLDPRGVAEALAGPVRAELTLGDGSVAAVFRVGGLQGPAALLVCARPLVDLEPEQRAALEQTAAFLALEAGRRQSVRAVAARFAGELVAMLADGPHRAPELKARLRSYGLAPDGPLVVLSVAPGEGDGAATAVAEELPQLWAAHGASAVVVPGADDVVVIAGWPGTLEELHRAAGEVAAGLAGHPPGRSAVVGVGRIAGGSDELARSLTGAREARRAAQRQPGGPAVVTFESASSFRSLLSMQDPELLEEFVLAVLSPLRRHDDEHGTQLEHTVRTFLDTGGRLSTAAQELHVHVNTLRNRLRRIEQLTGRDLEQTEHRVDLHLALHASGG